MAKELGLSPRSLIKNIPSPKQQWKAPVKEWVRDIYQRRYGTKPRPGKATKRSRSTSIPGCGHADAATRRRTVIGEEHPGRAPSLGRPRRGLADPTARTPRRAPPTVAHRAAVFAGSSGADRTRQHRRCPDDPLFICQGRRLALGRAGMQFQAAARDDRGRLLAALFA